MTAIELHINPHARINCYQIGEEQQPVLVIDDFLNNPDALIEKASMAPFAPDRGFFPGHRAEAPSSYTKALEQALPGLLSDVFGIKPEDINQVESSFSLVTQSPESLHPLQRIPHFDSREPNELASIYFLCNQDSTEYSGTAFYRHRSTGFEYVDQERFNAYMTALEADAKAHGAPPAEYICDDTDMFTQIGVFKAAFNRILVYRCTSLHSGVIEEDFDFSLDPSEARLSINSFLVK